MILAVAWAKECELIGEDTVLHKKRWERGTVLKKGKAKLVWDFEFNLRKTNTSRRPDLILEDKESKKIWICGMKSVMVELSNVLNKNELAKQVAGEMQKTILMDSESTICKVLSGLIQGENVDEQMDT